MKFNNPPLLVAPPNPFDPEPCPDANPDNPLIAPVFVFNLNPPKSLNLSLPACSVSQAGLSDSL